MFIGITNEKMTGLYTTASACEAGESIFPVEPSLFNKLRSSIKLWRYVRLVGVNGELIPKLVNAPSDPTKDYHLSLGQYDPSQKPNILINSDNTISSTIQSVGFLISVISPLVCFGSTTTYTQTSIVNQLPTIDYNVVFNDPEPIPYNIYVNKLYTTVAGNDPQLLGYDINSLHPLLAASK